MILHGVDGMRAVKNGKSKEYYDNYSKIFEQRTGKIQESNKEEKNSGKEKEEENNIIKTME